MAGVEWPVAMFERKYRVLDLGQVPAKVRMLDEQLQRVTLEQRMPGCDVSDRRIFGLGDSLSYRADAINYNLYALYEQHGKVIDKLDWFDPDPWLRIHSRRHLSYLLDNLVFNLVSMFDYFSKYVAFVYSLDNWGGYSWKRIVRSPSEELPSETANLIVRTNETIVHPLSEFRNRAIHERATLISTEESFHLGFGEDKESTLDYRGFLPDQLAEIVRPLFPSNQTKAVPEGRQHGIDLHDGSEMIVTVSVESLYLILRSMRKTKDGEKITVMG